MVNVDKFEAMRQTLTRNRHGSNDPLLLGRLYARMKKERKDLSNRELAAELGLSEGTIRIYLNYELAASVRSECAPAGADALIRQLKAKQVAHYLKLPAGRRNEWLEAGAHTKDAKPLLAEAAKVRGRTTLRNRPTRPLTPTLPLLRLRTRSWRPAKLSSTTKLPPSLLIRRSSQNWNTAGNGPTGLRAPSSSLAVLADPQILNVARRIIKQGS